MGPKKPYLLITHFSWNFSTHPLISYPYLKGFSENYPIPQWLQKQNKTASCAGFQRNVGANLLPWAPGRGFQNASCDWANGRHTAATFAEGPRWRWMKGRRLKFRWGQILLLQNMISFIFSISLLQKDSNFWKVFLKNKSGANLYVAFLHLNDQALSRLGLCQWCPNVPAQKLLRRPAQRWHPSANTRVPTKRRRLNLKLQWNASYK